MLAVSLKSAATFFFIQSSYTVKTDLVDGSGTFDACVHMQRCAFSEGESPPVPGSVVQAEELACF